MSNFFDEMVEYEVKKILESDSAKRTVDSKKKAIRRRNNRARIGRCLYELKQILLNCDSDLLTMRRNGPRPGAMEKVDIMEMTLDHVRHLTNKVNHSNKLHMACHEGGSSHSNNECPSPRLLVGRAKPEEVVTCEADSTSSERRSVQPVNGNVELPSAKRARVEHKSVFRPWQT